MKEKKKTRKKKIALVIVLAFLICAGALLGFMKSGTYKAVGVEKYLTYDENVNVTDENNVLFFDSKGENQALIFYPGAKVEYTAYAPLLHKLAENGIDCFLVKMPMDFAFLGVNKADDIINSHSYKSWSLAGHSLGGAMIANYVATTKTDANIDGLYLLASYPTKDIKSINDVLYIYGENDKVLNKETLENSKQYAPDNYREYIISGGNHAGFGYYGDQDGDGIATITSDEQINITVNQILNK